MTSFFKNFGDSQIRYFYLLAAVMVSLPIHMNLNAFCISLFSLNAILSFKKRNFEDDKGLLISYSFYVLFFIISALSLIYSDHLDLGLSKIQTKLGFLVIPFAFASNLKNLSKSKIQCLLRSLIVSVLLCTVFCYIESFIKALSLRSFVQMYDSNLSDPLMHRAYFSLFLGISILLWWEDIHFLAKFRIYGILLFLITIILLQGRINILAFLLVAALIFIIKYSRTFSKKQNFLGVSLVLLAILAFSFLPKKYNRFNQPLTLEYNLSDTNSSDFTGITIRLAIWDIALPLAKEDIFLGRGIGDSHVDLVDQFQEKQFIIGIEKKFNCHNQFIESTLASGIFSLLALLGILVIYLLFSMGPRHYFLAGMVIYFFLSMLTESLLERHWGISILTIIIPLYAKYIRMKN